MSARIPEIRWELPLRAKQSGRLRGHRWPWPPHAPRGFSTGSQESRIANYRTPHRLSLPTSSLAAQTGPGPPSIRKRCFGPVAHSLGIA